MTSHGGVLHPTYLPFTESQLGEHFAQVKGGKADDRHLAYYAASVKARAGLAQIDNPTPGQIAHGRQMEKDERFWVATALMSLFHAQPANQRVELFARLLAQAGIRPPSDFGSWQAALDGELHLDFEANLPAPKAYREWLAVNYPMRTTIPYSLEAAAKHPKRLEGTTKVDALLISAKTGTTIIFEAKVLSDISTRVQYDLMRNQLARIIDVALEPPYGVAPLDSRDPARTYVVLLTPEILSPRSQHGGARSRLYGWLMPEYQDPSSGLLAEHLPHRKAPDLEGVAGRLGWVTWEDCDSVLPGACPWLQLDNE